MARTELRAHPKFKRLCQSLRLPPPFVMGLLECMWHVGYQSGNSALGDEEDVELAAEWPHDSRSVAIRRLCPKGHLARALLDSKFIVESDGIFSIYNLLKHSPDFVKRRLKKRSSNNKDLQQNRADDGCSIQHNTTQQNRVPPSAPSGAGADRASPKGDNPQKSGNADSLESEKGEPAGFSAFWKEWPSHPRKKGRSKSRRVWERRDLERISDQLIQAVKLFKNSPDWRKNSGEFIPGPERWLNDESWEVPFDSLGQRDDPNPSENGFIARSPTPEELAEFYPEDQS